MYAADLENLLKDPRVLIAMFTNTMSTMYWCLLCIASAFPLASAPIPYERLVDLNSISHSAMFQALKADFPHCPAQDSPIVANAQSSTCSDEEWKRTTKEFMLGLYQHFDIATTQTQLLLKMDDLLVQAQQLGFELTVELWNTFFERFYRFPCEKGYKDAVVFELLVKMRGKGSGAKPERSTFAIILQGIASNPGIENPKLLSALVRNAYDLCCGSERQSVVQLSNDELMRLLSDVNLAVNS